MKERPWFKTYQELALPVQHTPQAHASVTAMLEAAMREYAAKPAFRSLGQTLTCRPCKIRFPFPNQTERHPDFRKRP